MSKEPFGEFHKSNPFAPSAPSDNPFLATPAPQQQPPPPAYGQPLYDSSTLSTPSSGAYPSIPPPSVSSYPTVQQPVSHRVAPPVPPPRTTTTSFGIPGLQFTVSERPEQTSIGLSVGGLVGALLGTGRTSSTMHVTPSGVAVETQQSGGRTSTEQLGAYGTRLPPQPHYQYAAPVPSPVPVPVAGSMPLNDFVASLDQMKAAYFEKGRFEVLSKMAGCGARFDCQQLSAILDALKHHSERLKAVDMFGPLVIDAYYNGVRVTKIEKIKEYDEVAQALAKYGIRMIK